jgi:hypothetical protein
MVLLLTFLAGAYHSADLLSSVVLAAVNEKNLASFSSELPPIQAAKAVLRTCAVLGTDIPWLGFD